MKTCGPCFEVLERGAHAAYEVVELHAAELPPPPEGVESWHAAAVAMVKLVAHLRRLQRASEG